jgi:hypothetical protein
MKEGNERTIGHCTRYTTYTHMNIRAHYVRTHACIHAHREKILVKRDDRTHVGSNEHSPLMPSYREQSVFVLRLNGNRINWIPQNRAIPKATVTK